MPSIPSRQRQTTSENATCVRSQLSFIFLWIFDVATIDSHWIHWSLQANVSVFRHRFASKCGRSNFVSKKWPIWFVPNWLSRPSTVKVNGLAMTPALFIKICLSSLRKYTPGMLFTPKSSRENRVLVCFRSVSVVFLKPLQKCPRNLDLSRYHDLSWFVGELQRQRLGCKFGCKFFDALHASQVQLHELNLWVKHLGNQPLRLANKHVQCLKPVWFCEPLHPPLLLFLREKERNSGVTFRFKSPVPICRGLSIGNSLQ